MSMSSNKKQVKTPLGKKIVTDIPTQVIAPLNHQRVYHTSVDDDHLKHTQGPAKRVPSNVPTALIAPSDYQHLYHNVNTEKKGRENRIESSMPTAIIAPSDYEYIYNCEKEAKQQPLRRSPSYYNLDQIHQRKAMRVSSQTPTYILVKDIPDFEHMYTTNQNAEAKKTPTQESKSEQEFKTIKNASPVKKSQQPILSDAAYKHVINFVKSRPAKYTRNR